MGGIFHNWGRTLQAEETEQAKAGMPESAELLRGKSQ